MKELLEKGRALYVYQESGQYDLEEMKDDPFDGVWCSIYDMLKLAHFGIVEEFDKEDYDEAYAYLKEAMPYTTNHKNHEFEF